MMQSWKRSRIKKHEKLNNLCFSESVAQPTFFYSALDTGYTFSSLFWLGLQLQPYINTGSCLNVFFYSANLF